MKFARFYMNEAVCASKARSQAAPSIAAAPAPAATVEVDGSDTLSAALSAVETAEALTSAEQRLVMGKGRSEEAAKAELGAAVDALIAAVSTRGAKVAGYLTALAFVKAATVAVRIMESATPTQQFRMGEGAGAYGGGMGRQRMKSFLDTMRSRHRGGSPSPSPSPRHGGSRAAAAGATGARATGGAGASAATSAAAGTRPPAGAGVAARAVASSSVAAHAAAGSSVAPSARLAPGARAGARASAGAAVGVNSFVVSGIVRKKPQLRMSCAELIENSESFARPAPGATAAKRHRPAAPMQAATVPSSGIPLVPPYAPAPPRNAAALLQSPPRAVWRPGGSPGRPAIPAAVASRSPPAPAAHVRAGCSLPTVSAVAASAAAEITAASASPAAGAPAAVADGNENEVRS